MMAVDMDGPIHKLRYILAIFIGAAVTAVLLVIWKKKAVLMYVQRFRSSGS
ncbi:hypothetical protein [Peribacillus glennii]|uniref:hypothetical protein n=1 Tax=Peribacillus glennii TaxID=2303991 RepID=UPI00131479A3|nr:hypothetical protein [Peribacillus glennii]